MAPLGASEATPDHIDKEGDVDGKQRRHEDVKHLPHAKMKTRDGTDRGEKSPCGSPGRRGSERPDGRKNVSGKVQSEPMASKKETKIGAQETEEGKDNIVHSHASARKQQRDERDAKRSARLGRHERTEADADHCGTMRESRRPGKSIGKRIDERRAEESDDLAIQKQPSQKR